MRKKLGQYFLKDRNILERIVAALDLKKNDTVIEVGAGHGELTQQLKIKNQKSKIIAIEKDPKLAGYLKNKFSDDEEIKIIEGDVLKVLEPTTYNLTPTTYKIVGNIPYYITGYLLRKISELENKPELCVFTIQKEVAERLAARPPKMNRLAACVQFWTKPEIIGDIPKGAFSPPPEVESAIIRLQVIGDRLEVSGKNYYGMVRRLFQQPRKTILNNLAAKKGEGSSRGEVLESLKSAGIRPEARPQDLEIDQIIEIVGKIQVDNL